MTLVELTISLPKILLTHEQEGKFFWCHKQDGYKLHVHSFVVQHCRGSGGINKSKEIASCVDIIT